MRICDNELIRIDYVNGELGPLRRILFGWHMAWCPTCKGAVEALAGVSRAVRMIPRPEVSPDVVTRTKEAMASLQPAVPQGPWRIGWFLEAWERPRVIAAGALATAGVVGLVLGCLNGSLASLLAATSRLDVWALLSGGPSQPEVMLALPVGAVLVIAVLVSIPALIDNALLLAAHRALVRSGLAGNDGPNAAVRVTP